MSEVAPPQIFLSHSSRDADLVRHVKRALEQAGSCQVYLAEEHPRPGEHLPTKLLTALQASVGFVVLLTEAGADSTLVQQEVGAARGFGLPVAAVVVPGLASDLERLGMLAGQEHILFDASNPARALLDLQVWFQALPQSVGQAHSPYPRSQSAKPFAPAGPLAAGVPPLPAAAASALALVLILILAGIALYAISVSSRAS